MTGLKHKLFHLALFALVAIMPVGASSLFGSETPTVRPAIATNSDTTIQKVWWGDRGGGHRWRGGHGYRWGYRPYYRPYYRSYYNYYSPYYSYYPRYYSNCYYVWSNGSYIYYCN